MPNTEKGFYMKHYPPRIAAIHDLSCFGRCALTVVMPTLSVMGYQTVPVPTALLSTHTGGFDDLHFCDLTDHMEAISDHFLRLGVTFRAVYTGFLGSVAQIDTVSRFLDTFGALPDESGQTPLVLIDPVMGDDGVLYSTYTDELVEGMRRISARAHLLTPNLTEACLLTEMPYRSTAEMSEEEAASFLTKLLQKLSELTAGDIVITGAHMRDGMLCNAGRDRNGALFTVTRPHVGHAYPGTGEIFASVLLGTLLDGVSFPDACARAADFVSTVIEGSSKADEPIRNGVALEHYLHLLAGHEKNDKTNERS